MTAIRVLVVSAAVLTAVGCESGFGGAGDIGVTYQSSPPTQVDRATVFQIALEEARQRCRVTDSDAVTGMITCAPDYLDRASAAPDGRLRVVSSKSDLRRVVRLRMPADAGGTRVEISAALERRDTESMQQYRALRASQDVPTETPIDTGAGLSPDRREVWTPIGRDHGLEAEILASIQARLVAPTTQPSGTGK